MTAAPLPPRKRCRGNLRPAQFFLTPATIRGVLEIAVPARMAMVPIEPIKLVDQPRAARPAKANDEVLPTAAEVPAAVSEPERVAPQTAGASGLEGRLQVDWPDAPLPEEFEFTGADDFARDHGGASHPGRAAESAERESDSCANVTSVAALGELSFPANARQRQAEDVARASSATPFSPGEYRQARRSDKAHVQRGNQDARALEAPVDVRLHKGERPRIELIRAAARKLAEHNAAAKARLPIGAPVPPRERAIPPLAPAQRMALLNAAIAFLKRQAVLVSVYDRTAPVRRYLVSGKRGPLMAEDVIELAREKGFSGLSGGSCD